jgi:Saf4/Yju2 protein
MPDPKNMDYTAEAGAQRNFEQWRDNHIEEADERLQRLEAEAAGAEADAMQDLETKMLDAQHDVAVADPLDEIRAVNARVEKAADMSEASLVKDIKDEQREREEADDAEAARKAF